MSLSYEPTEAYATNIVRQCRSAGLPEDASRWLVRALHPPCDGPLVSLPDESTLNAVRISYRPTRSVALPPGLATDANWDLCIVVPPGDCTGAVWCAGPSGTDFTAQAPQPDTTVGLIGVVDDFDEQYVFNNSTDPSLGRTGYTLMPKGQYMGYRTVASSVTVTNTSSDLYNGGRVYAGQYATSWTQCNGLAAATVKAGSVSSERYVGAEQYAYLPLGEEALSQLTPRYYAAPAKEGVYLPLRLNNRQGKYIMRPAPSGRLIHLNEDTVFSLERSLDGLGFSTRTVGVWPLVLTGQHVEDGGVGEAIEPPGYSAWINRALRGNFPYLSQDSGFDDVATGVIIMRGLDPHAVIEIKILRALELIPYQLSPLMTLIQPPPSPCPEAIELYFRIVNELPMGYPARMNFLGGLLPILGRALVSAFKLIRPVAKAVGKAAIGAAVPAAAGALVNAVSGKGQTQQRGQQFAPVGSTLPRDMRPRQGGAPRKRR